MALPSLEEFEKDPDILWLREMEVDYALKYNRWGHSKEDAERILMERIGFKDRNSFKIVKLGHTFTADGTVYFKEEDVANLGGSIDTIITFDPKTFKETIQIVTSKFRGKSIKNLRLIEDWVWEDKANSLSIRYVGFAPIIDRIDDNGNFLNSGPMFIRKIEDIQ